MSSIILTEQNKAIKTQVEGLSVVPKIAILEQFGKLKQTNALINRDKHLKAALEKLIGLIKNLDNFADPKTIKEKLTIDELRAISTQLRTDKGRADYLRMLITMNLEYIEDLLKKNPNLDDNYITYLVNKPLHGLADAAALAASEVTAPPGFELPSREYIKKQLFDSYHRFYSSASGGMKLTPTKKTKSKKTKSKTKTKTKSKKTKTKKTKSKTKTKKLKVKLKVKNKS